MTILQYRILHIIIVVIIIIVYYAEAAHRIIKT